MTSLEARESRVVIRFPSLRSFDTFGPCAVFADDGRRRFCGGRFTAPSAANQMELVVVRDRARALAAQRRASRAAAADGAVCAVATDASARRGTILAYVVWEEGS
jgi:hypothetical protein